MWLVCLLLLLTQNCMAYEFDVLKGDKLTAILPFIAEQRINIFCDYPYLYDGTVEDEMAYLQWFAASPHGAVAVVYHQQKPVGFLTGAPNIAFAEHFVESQKQFELHNFDFASFYYFSECIVLPEHRGNNLSTQLGALLEAYALQEGFTNFCFVTEEHELHPLKPDTYISLDLHWEKMGYTKSNITIKQRWKTFQVNGESVEIDHILTYWLKLNGTLKNMQNTIN